MQQRPASVFGPLADDHLRQPRNLGKLARPDGVGTVEEPASDTILTVSVALAVGPDGRRLVEAARFRALGCGGCIVAGSVLTELATGASLDAAGRLDAAAIHRALADGLPPEQRYCADLAIEAFRRALGAATAPA